MDCTDKIRELRQLLNPINAKLNPICPLLALFRAHHILHVSRIRVKNIFLLHSSKRLTVEVTTVENGERVTNNASYEF